MSSVPWRPPRPLRRLLQYPPHNGTTAAAWRRIAHDELPRRHRALVAAWGQWGPNQVADRAGRYRRVAIGFALLVAPMTLMTVSLVGRPEYQFFALTHAAVAASFLWVARDLILWGGLSGPAGWPHPSALALVACTALLQLGRPEEFGAPFGSMPLFTPGLVVLGAGLLVLMIDERAPDHAVDLTGRALLIVGGAVLGLAESYRALHGWHHEPWYSIGVAMTGALLGGMAHFEARLVWRAISLAVVEARRS